MCKSTPLFHWLMEYMLRRRCEGSKNKMADLLSIDRQTLRRAFRRTEQENAGVTPMLAERMIHYFFVHKDQLDQAIAEYGENAKLSNTCPQEAGGYALTDYLNGSMDVPQYDETVRMIESFQEAIGCRSTATAVTDKAAQGTLSHCQVRNSCPIWQLITLYNHYLAATDAGANLAEGGDVV